MPEVENKNQFHPHALLVDLAIGASARVLAVNEPGSLGERMLEMGLTPGTVVRILRRGLFGDPIQLALRGSLLSLRKAQAQSVAIEPLP